MSEKIRNVLKFDKSEFERPKRADSQEREAAWQKKVEEVEQIVDPAGIKVDERIRDPVAALSLYGFSTYAACEGHMREDNERMDDGTEEAQNTEIIYAHLSYPWIRICVSEVDEIGTSADNKSDRLSIEVKRKNREQRQKMTSLLNTFYKTRAPLPDARLITGDLNMLASFRLKCVGSDRIDSLPREEREKKLAQYQHEVQDFAEFLKQRYLSE